MSVPRKVGLTCWPGEAEVPQSSQRAIPDRGARLWRTGSRASRMPARMSRRIAPGRSGLRWEVGWGAPLKGEGKVGVDGARTARPPSSGQNVSLTQLSAVRAWPSELRPCRTGFEECSAKVWISALVDDAQLSWLPDSEV